MSNQWQPQQDPRRRQPVTPPQWGQQPPPRDPWAPSQPQYQQQPPQYQQPQGWGPQPQYQPPYQPPQPPRRRKPNKGLRIFAWCSVGFLVLVVLIVALSSSKGSSSPAAAPSPTQTQSAVAAQPAAKAAPKAAAAQTVTYAVTGSAANVTYGPAGTSLSGAVPMQVTKPLGTPLYYSISAQLQGSGTVSCKIEVDGKAISSSTASGGYNIATCEISPDPLTGQWSDTNG
jgi:hypothetical protein